jgi:hypothetical protein
MEMLSLKNPPSSTKRLITKRNFLFIETLLITVSAKIGQFLGNVNTYIALLIDNVHTFSNRLQYDTIFLYGFQLVPHDTVMNWSTKKKRHIS